MHLEATTTPVRGGAAGATAAVELKDVARRFGRRWALRGITLRVDPGEVVALLGHNGSGKTTLLRLASTALRPSRGEGRIFGFDLLREVGRIRELVGVLGHAPGLYGDLSAAENLRFALRMMGRPAPEGAVMDALAAVGLEREAESRVRYFSAGMQRRLALSRLMLSRPRLVLLDEPYSAFDTDGIERLNTFLAELKAAGHAILIATHDLERARPVMDRIVRLAEGRVVEAVDGVGERVVARELQGTEGLR